MIQLLARQTLGYDTFRIPALLATAKGILLAFCEGRVASMADYGAIHVLCMRSTDGGKTWSAPAVVAREGEATMGNACPVEAADGSIHLLGNWNAAGEEESQILNGTAQPRRTWHCVSRDDGISWSEPEDITPSVREKGWTWYACGPCHGVRMANGRLLIPCNHGLLHPLPGANSPYVPHVIFSDDNGASWQLGGEGGIDGNESTLAVLPDGGLYFNIRSYKGHACRQHTWSRDGGETFLPPMDAADLPEPVCQGSVLNVRDALYFINPAMADERTHLTLKKSLDGGKTWKSVCCLWEGPAAYGDLQILGDSLFVLFEAGREHAYEGLRLWQKKLSDL